MKNKPSDQDQKGQKIPELNSLKKTIGIASVVAWLGASLGVNVGDLLADEKVILKKSPMTTSDVQSNQYKLSNQGKISNQHNIFLEK